MSTHDFRHGSDASSTSTSAPSRAAPGKRTRTQALPPRPRAASVADLAAIEVTDDWTDTRATIDTQLDHGPDLSERQLAKARRNNPRALARHALSPVEFSSAAPDSDEFALDVAARQARLGVQVDGIVGPKTAAAIATADARQGPRAIVDRDGDLVPDVLQADPDPDADCGDPARAPEPREDDPFALHLLR